MAGNIGTVSLPKTSKNFANGLRSLVDVAYKKKKDMRTGIFSIEDTVLEIDRLVEMGGLSSEPVRRNAGERAAEDTLREGYEKFLTQVEYDKAVPVDYQAKKFQNENVRLLQRSAEELANVFYLLEQKAAFSLLMYSQSDTNTYLEAKAGAPVSALLPNGKRLSSTVHPTFPDNSTTWSNTLSANDDVSEESCDLMLQNLYVQPDDKGEPLNFGQEGVYWLVPRARYKRALEITKSDKRSGTSDNDTNVLNGSYNGFDVEVLCIPWLSNYSSTAHYMIDKKVASSTAAPLRVLYSDRFMTDTYEDDASKTEYVRGQVYFGVGAVSGRGICISAGTGTGTYSS